MGIRTAGELHSEVSKLGGGFIDGTHQPRAAVMLMDVNSSTMYQIEGIEVETDEETGQQTVWIKMEEY